MTVLPSGEIATATTQSVCPVRVLTAAPEDKSHTFRVLSFEAETAVLPSGAIATAFTSEICPVRVFTASPEGKSHTFRV